MIHVIITTPDKCREGTRAVSMVARSIITEYPSMVVGPSENVPGYPACYTSIVLLFDAEPAEISRARHNWEGLVLFRSHGNPYTGDDDAVSDWRVNVAFIDSGQAPELDPASIEMVYYESRHSLGKHESLKTAVRAIHRPTGITVDCDQAPSAFHNSMMAWSLLRLKVLPAVGAHHGAPLQPDGHPAGAPSAPVPLRIIEGTL